MKQQYIASGVVFGIIATLVVPFGVFASALLLLPPTLLTVQLLPNQSVVILWQDHSSNERGFIIERSVNHGAYQQVGMKEMNAAAYIDMPLVRPGFFYSYRVRTVGMGSTSVFSNDLGIEPMGKPVTPTGLTAIPWPYGAAQVQLSWNDGANNEIGMSIERSSDGISFTEITNYQGINSTDFFDGNLASGAMYWYRVRALGLGMYSDYSIVASVVAP